MNQKIRNYIYFSMFNILKGITHVEFPDLNVGKIVDFWLNLLDWFFKIVTTMSFTLAFVWWFPKFYKFETLVLILLCIIVIELRMNRN